MTLSIVSHLERVLNSHYLLYLTLKEYWIKEYKEVVLEQLKLMRLTVSSGHGMHGLSELKCRTACWIYMGSLYALLCLWIQYTWHNIVFQFFVTTIFNLSIFSPKERLISIVDQQVNLCYKSVISLTATVPQSFKKNFQNCVPLSF